MFFFQALGRLKPFLKREGDPSPASQTCPTLSAPSAPSPAGTPNPAGTSTDAQAKVVVRLLQLSVALFKRLQKGPTQVLLKQV